MPSSGIAELLTRYSVRAVVGAGMELELGLAMRQHQMEPLTVLYYTVTVNSLRMTKE